MAKDGFYTCSEIINVFQDRFNSEKEMKNFIIDRIHSFCENVLGVKYKSHISEYKISDGKRKNKSIDILIESKQGQLIAIELKNPIHKSELQSALGQILVYHTALKISGRKVDRMVLVSSVYDYLIPITIQDMNLPIEFICMDHNKFATMNKI